MHRLDLFPTEELICQYRQVFTSRAAGPVVLHMLYDLGVFSESPATPEDVALRNYGMRLLRILGGGEIQEDAIASMIKGVVRQPLRKGSA